VTLRAAYGAFSEHVIYYIVEAENLNAIYRFLDPEWTLSTSTITPVGEERARPLPFPFSYFFVNYDFLYMPAPGQDSQ
jgi:hypothetical protein